MIQAQSPKLAVVILNWNGRQWLEQFLPSVVRNTPESCADVIVVDNASSDDSVAWLREHYPNLQLLRWEQNWGYAEGYNKAVAQLSYPYLCLLNSDVEIQDADWLQRPIEIFDTDPRVATIQPKILSQKAPHLFEYAGAAGGYVDRWGYPFCRGRIMDEVEADLGQYDTESEIFWSSGAALFVRRDAFLEAGGLDATFFAHMEEIDLAWRLWHLGYKAVYTPLSKVYHVGGGTLVQENPQKTYLNFRNNHTMLYKNLFPERQAILVFRKGLDLLSMCVFLLQGKRNHAHAVWQALRDHRKARQQVVRFASRSLRPRGASPLEKVSIVGQFFLLRNKRFSDLPLVGHDYHTPCQGGLDPQKV